jgi:hypothetical protein
VLGGATHPSRPSRVPGRRLGRGERLVCATVALAGLGALGAALLVWWVAGVEIGDLTRDPATSQEFARYVGALSYLGVLAWTVGATAALVGARAAAPGSPARRFLVAAGLLTAWLALDDLFLVHEYVGGLIREGGRGSDLVLGTYALAGVAVMWRWRSFTLRETPISIVLVVGGLLFLSLVFDALGRGGSAQYLLEDGPKLLGLMGWTTYLALVALRLAGAPHAGRAPSAAAGEDGASPVPSAAAGARPPVA